MSKMLSARARRLLAPLATGLTVMFLALGLLPALAPGPRYDPHHQGPRTAADTGGQGLLGGRLVVYHTNHDGPLAYIRADVAVDEEFVASHGHDWILDLRRTLQGVNELLEPLGLQVEADSIQRWRSDGALRYISSHIGPLSRQVRRAPGNVLLAIAGQHMLRYDGWARSAGSEVLVQMYDADPRRTSVLIAHEIGHLLGARHHEREEECQQERCLMDRRGYAQADTWCDHHREFLRDAIRSTM